MNQPTINSRVIKTELINWRELQFIQQDNFKEWVNSGEQKLIESILKYQFIAPFMVWQNEGVNYCLDGRHRYMDLEKVSGLGANVPELLPATFVDCANMKEAAELVLVYSSAYARITQQGLFDFVNNFDLDFPDLQAMMNIPEFDDVAFQGLLNKMEGNEEEKIISLALKDSFIFSPFSILDTRSGVWQERKRKWLALGFNSQETREDVEIIAKSGQSTAIYELRNKMRESLGRDPEWDEILEYAKKKGMHIYEGASIFDPVLCELSYRWFCPDGGKILDPFAGGSVRGIVAGVLDFNYVGVDLRPDQCVANRNQASILNLDVVKTQWLAGDSNEVLEKKLSEDGFDFVYSCPPYAYLEKYSDDPKDLSNMDYEDFKDVYFSIIKKSVEQLKDDRFACFVVGDVRDKKGFYLNFVSDTIQAFKDAGMELYNEIILVNVVGSLAIRVRRQFNGGRKIGKMHQNVLVFYKGDPKKIKENYPELHLEEDIESFNNELMEI
ncbi:MAG TPA: class I SAM-dependent methyltransferase [Flavobacterium sp.]|jgi:DNA modification methylase